MKPATRPAAISPSRIDCAASEFFKDGSYRLEAEGLTLSAAEWTATLAAWCDKYPIVSIEDGMAENDWDGWEQLTRGWATKCSWSVTTCS